MSVRRPETLRRWIAAYAAATATTASYETIRDAATGGQNDKPSRSTTQPWRDVLERLWILDPVPAWLPTQNYLNRLAQLPKHHLADPALAASILGFDADALLKGAKAGPRIPRSGLLRLHGGSREVDLIIERSDRRIVAIEVKLGRTVDEDDVRHLHWLRERIGTDLLDTVVINTGPEAYRRKDGTAVIPAALLGP